MSRMPRTINGLDAFEVMSALQKHCRRGEEWDALHCLAELVHTSKSFHTMACNRLEVIAHEDIGLAAPQVVMFVAHCVDHSKRCYAEGSGGKPRQGWRLSLANAVLALCRAPKSGEADHAIGAVMQPAEWYGKAPQIPDCALDMHTHRGKKMGRGLSHFISEGSLRLPHPKPNDFEPVCWYEREAHANAAQQAEPQRTGENNELF